MRVLITGAAGQLGHDVVTAFETSPAGHEVIAAGREQLDVVDRGNVLGSIWSTRPDAIVHTAAWTAVDACEEDAEKAFAVNSLGTRNVAEAAAQVGAHLCYISTDYVFDGTKDGAYHEWDEPRPRSVYGCSKLGGEREVVAMGTPSSIVRTSWVCGAHGNNMVKTILGLANEHDTLRFVDDQRGHPTFTSDLADAILRLVVERRPGMFHLTNAGAVSWYGFAREVMSAAGLDPDRVQPVATTDLDPPRPAPRPANSVLDNAAWRIAGMSPLRDFREPLSELVAALEV